MQFGRVIATCAAAVLLCVTSSALLADETLQVFDGTTDVVEIGPWGSGEIEIGEEQTFAERQTLAVVTKGYHEGGRLDLKQPVDFTAFGADPIQTQLIIVVKAKEPEQTYGGYGLPGGAPMMPGGLLGGPGAAAPGGMPMVPGMEPMGRDEPMMPGGGGIGTATVSQPPEPIDRIRVVLVTDKGQLSSGGLLLDPNLAFEDDWLRLSAVLSDFARPEDLQGATLQRVVITGNHEGRVYVGDLKIIQEDTPLVANIEGAAIRTVPAGQAAQFTANPQHEGVNASYEWDFDDLDGLGIDGYGQKLSYQFPEAGYYVVTLRVADRDGQLQPRIATIKVKVE